MHWIQEFLLCCYFIEFWTQSMQWLLILSFAFGFIPMYGGSTTVPEIIIITITMWTVQLYPLQLLCMVMSKNSLYASIILTFELDSSPFKVSDRSMIDATNRSKLLKTNLPGNIPTASKRFATYSSTKKRRVGNSRRKFFLANDTVIGENNGPNPMESWMRKKLPVYYRSISYKVGGHFFFGHRSCIDKCIEKAILIGKL